MCYKFLNNAFEKKENSSSLLTIVIYCERIICHIIRIYKDIANQNHKFCAILVVYEVKDTVIQLVRGTLVNKMNVNHSDFNNKPLDKDFIELCLELILHVLQNNFNADYFDENNNKINALATFLRIELN